MKGLDNYLTDEPNTRERIEWRNSIHLGDCIEVMKGIPTAGVDMILCDLPYGTTACPWDTVIPFEQLWNEYLRVIKENGAIVLFGSQPFSSLLIQSCIKYFRQELIWDKMVGGCFVHANKRVLPAHENLLLFYKKLPTYNPIMVEKEKSKIRPKSNATTESNVIPMSSGKTEEKCDRTKSYPTSILSYSRKMGECNESQRVHPTQKPLALLQYLITTYTNEEEIVLDNCMGSGSTCVACKNTGRTYIGIEKEEKYYKIAEQRLTSLF